MINGDLGAYGIKSPLATDGIQVVFGAEYRRDALDNSVDALQVGNQLSGGAGSVIPISGSTTGAGPLLRRPHPDRPGPGVRGEPLLRYRVPVLGLR